MRRIILRTKPSRDSLHDFFYEAGWTLLREHKRTKDGPDPSYIGWVLGKNRDWGVQYVDDHTLGLAYFVIKTRDPEHEPRVEAIIRKGPFELQTSEEVVQEFEAANNAEDTLSAFRKLVLVAPENRESQFEQYFQRVLKHADPKVRAEALGLITYVGWPELKPLIEELEKDPDDAVRKNARIVLDGYKELGIA